MRILLVLLIFCSISEAGLFDKLFGLEAIKKEIITNNNNIQNQNKKIFEDIATIKNNQITAKMFSDFEIKLTNNIDTKINPMVDGLQGINASTKKLTEAGRDVNTNITNDPTLLKVIITGLLGIIGILLKASFDTKKWLQNEISSKEKYKKVVEEKIINGGGVKS